MCRRNQLHGWAAIALGAGILLGARLEAGFITTLLAFGVIALGIAVLQKK